MINAAEDLPRLPSGTQEPQDAAPGWVDEAFERYGNPRAFGSLRKRDLKPELQEEMMLTSAKAENIKLQVRFDSDFLSSLFAGARLMLVPVCTHHQIFTEHATRIDTAVTHKRGTWTSVKQARMLFQLTLLYSV